MFANVRNIYCVGRNYRAHAEELGNEVPEEPMLFTKPTHALVPLDGRTVGMPQNSGSIHYETELVIRISRSYEPGLRADELVDGLAFGIDFTLRDVQSAVKKKGQPWLPAKGFLNSAPLSAFRPFPGVELLAEKEFALLKNGAEAQRGNVRNMIFDLQTILDFVGTRYGLGEGDIVFTGTPEGVGPVAAGDRLEIVWGEEPVGSIVIG